MYCKQKKERLQPVLFLYVGFNRALIAAKEDVGPETSSAKQSCFGSALSRRKSVFLVTFVTTDKSNPAEQKSKNRLHCLPTKEQRRSKICTGGARSRPRTLPVALFTHK